MASTHKHIRSGTANKRPTTAIADGQIALNTNLSSPGLFFKDSTGAEILKIGPVHVGATAPNASPAGSAGNSTGEIWLDTSLTPVGVKIWNGSAFVNATPIGSTTVQGLLELATDAETQAGADTARAVTSASLQSKLSDSTNTTSNTTIASSTAVKAAYDLANAALPKTGGTVTGNLEIGTAGSLSFEGATADGFVTTIAVVDPTADRTITLPNTTGTVVTTGDTGTVTSTMLLDGTILNSDVNASAAIAGTKISPDFGAQTIVTTGVHSAALGAAATPSITFTGDLNTGIYSPGADQLAVATNGTQKLIILSDGKTGIGASSPIFLTDILSGTPNTGANVNNPSQLSVTGPNKTLIGGGATFFVNSNSDFAIDNGGSIALTGRNTTSSTNSVVWGVVKGAKENATSTNTAGYLAFASQNHNTGALVEAMRIDSQQRVGIGVSSASNKLTIYEAAANPIRLIQDHGTSSAYGIEFYSQASTPYTVSSITASHGAAYVNPYLDINVADSSRVLQPRVRIDASGRVGIGTNAPAQKLEIMDGSISIGSSANINTANVLIAGYGYILSGTKYGNTSIRSTYENNSNTASLDFYVGTGSTATAEKMKLDAQGRLLVGTTGSFNGGLLCIGSGQGSNLPSGEYIKIAPSANRIEFLDSSSNLSDTGSISLHNTVYNNRSANIKLYHPAANTGGIAFETHDGTSLAERINISAGGNVTMTSVTSGAGGTHTMQDSGASPNTLRLYNVTDSNNTGNRFLICDAAASIMRAEIRSNGGLANYSANNANLSDRNVKKDITLAAGTWDCIKEWEIVNYRYKEQPDDADLNLGVIAQQVAESCPEVITIFQEAKEATEDKPAQEERLGVKEQQMYWMAIKGLQEAMGRIETLEQRLTAAGID